MKEFKSHDLSVPFVTSSPTNGKKTQDYPYFIADNPYDPNYGDVHYYNYKDDCRDWRNFPKARFVSEFGYQERYSSGKIIQKHLFFNIFKIFKITCMRLEISIFSNRINYYF